MRGLRIPGFHEQMRTVLAARKLSQEDAARLLGVKANQISRWCSNQMPGSFEMLQHIAETLDVSWRWLLCGPGEMSETGSASPLPPSAPPSTSPEEEARLQSEWAMLRKVYRGRREKPHLWEALQQNLKAFSTEAPDVEPGKVAPLSPKVVEMRQSRGQRTKRK